MLDILRQQRPIVTVHCGTRHFETCFLDLLGRGLILPGAVTRCNGYGLERRGFNSPNMDSAKWQVVCFAAKDRDKDDDGWRVGQAAQSPYPILVVSEGEQRVPSRLAAAAQLTLNCGDLNAAIVRRTIEAVLGQAPTEDLGDIDFGKLDLADLSIAIRAGTTPSSAVATLRMLVADADVEPSDDGGTAASGKSRDWRSASSGRPGRSPGGQARPPEARSSSRGSFPGRTAIASSSASRPSAAVTRPATGRFPCRRICFSGAPGSFIGRR